MERIRTKNAKVSDINPNPLDEFSNPKIGPNESAVSKYIKEINTNGTISESIEVQKLASGGYEIVNGSSEADICVINTCSVTNTADNKCKKVIRSIKRENDKAVLMVCGCASENHREDFMDLDIDILIGNKEKIFIVPLDSSFKSNL